jgi:hypothetical protein
MGSASGSGTISTLGARYASRSWSTGCVPPLAEVCSAFELTADGGPRGKILI